MATIEWHAAGSKYFQAGVDRGVLYIPGKKAVPWNGLISVNEAPQGGTITPLYLDGYKFRNIVQMEDFAATIKAWTYPDEFGAIDGTIEVLDSSDGIEGKGLMLFGQGRGSFNFSYRTLIGNDIDGVNAGYKIHLVYNATAEPTTYEYNSMNKNSEASALSWNIVTIPTNVPGHKPTAHFVIDSTKTDGFLLDAIETILYGTDTVAPRIPSPSEMVTMFANWLTFKVVDNGDGTWTATAPEPIIEYISETEFQINWFSIRMLDKNTYTISNK